MTGVCGGKLKIWSLFRILEEAILGEIADELPSWGVSDEGRHSSQASGRKYRSVNGYVMI